MKNNMSFKEIVLLVGSVFCIIIMLSSTGQYVKKIRNSFVANQNVRMREKVEASIAGYTLQQVHQKTMILKTKAVNQQLRKARQVIIHLRRVIRVIVLMILVTIQFMMITIMIGTDIGVIAIMLMV